MPDEEVVSRDFYPYRAEINKPTTGGQIGWSVRALGTTPAEAVELALDMAKRATDGCAIGLIVDSKDK